MKWRSKLECEVNVRVGDAIADVKRPESGRAQTGIRDKALPLEIFQENSLIDVVHLDACGLGSVPRW